jgi:hypothetical protein
LIGKTAPLLKFHGDWLCNLADIAIGAAPLTPSGEAEPDFHRLSRHAIMYK